jgi:two-component system LytT family sensor kinase
VLHTDGEFVTLGDELKLVRSYLDIERARFEERLRVSIEVPEDLLTLRIPSLLIQPLVENAIKHGITPSRYGGEVQIRAELESGETADQTEQLLKISVRDSGIGASEIELARGRRRGLGLNNVEERLHFYGGAAAALLIISTLGEGTMVEMKLPSKLSVAESDSSDKRIRAIRERKEA